jgi:hypothetical protein
MTPTVRIQLRVLTAFLLSAASVAHPQSGAVEAVGVLAVGEPPAGPEAELIDLARTFRASVAERFQGVLSQEDLRLRMLGQTGASLTELDRAYAGAVAANQAGDYEGAVRTLRAIVDDLERLPESDDGFRQWSRAMLRLARAEGSLGRKGESREVMERLIRADPSAKADPELYPPSFVKQVEEVRVALKALAKRKLVVTAGGRAARVFVEGRDVGAAPVTLTVAPGRYRVSGAFGDVRASGGMVEIGDTDQTVPLDFAVSETFRPAAGPGLAIPASQRATGIVAAGAALKLDRLLVASFNRDGDVRYLVGAVYDVRRGMLQREGLLRLTGFSPPRDGLKGLASFLATGERMPLVELPADDVAKKPKAKPQPAPAELRLAEPAEPATPSKGSALLRWSPVATAVLAVGLGAYAGIEAVNANTKYNDAKAMLAGGSLAPGLSSSTYNQLVTDGDDARSRAIVAGGGAAVAVIGTGVLSWLSYKQTGEVGPFRF